MLLVSLLDSDIFNLQKLGIVWRIEIFPENEEEPVKQFTGRSLGLTAATALIYEEGRHGR